MIYFCCLNWNTTTLLMRMVKAVEETVFIPHRWVFVDNGSEFVQYEALCHFIASAGDLAGKTYGLIRHHVNTGCIVGYNAAFDHVASVDRGPYDVVMINSDMTVHQEGWLSTVLNWADERPEVGVIGLEHSRGEKCAAAIFLGPGGYWYTQGDQTSKAQPVEGESVGLGFALVRWSVLKAGLRFDPVYKFYYKQDDDFTFQVRSKLGLEIWAYPINCVHHGRGSIKANKYKVGPARNKREFEAMKRENQRVFAERWAWLLRDRRGSMEAEKAHLAEMKEVMQEKGGKGS